MASTAFEVLNSRTRPILLLAGWALLPMALSAQSIDSTFVEWAASSRTVGIAAGVLDGSTQAIHVGGVRKVGGDAPITDSTFFVIGSVTKTFTGLLLAEMVVRGEVSVNDKLSEVLPDDWTVPSRDGREITLLDLATHTSGLPRLGPNMPITNPDQPYRTSDLSVLKQQLAQSTLATVPGASYAYSNFGMSVLGQALALHAGIPYAQLLKERVLTPLDLDDTHVGIPADLDTTRLASGHDATFLEVPIWDFGAYAPAGAIISTIPDLLKYLTAVRTPDNSPIGKAMALATTPARSLSVGTADSIGLGWHIRGVGEQRVIWHNGATAGFKAWLGVKRSGNRAVVVLQNVAVPWSDAIGGTLLAGQIRGTPPVVKPLQEVKIDQQTRAGLIGKYQLTPEMIVQISESANRLQLQLTGQLPFRIVATGVDQFVVLGVPAKLKFERDQDGQGSAVVLLQNGREQRAPRVP